MTELVSGGCLCGYVRYEYDGEIGSANYCHCRDCRKTTGSAFNIGICLQSSSLRIIAGQVKSYTKIAVSGNTEFMADKLDHDTAPATTLI